VHCNASVVAGVGLILNLRVGYSRALRLVLTTVAGSAAAADRLAYRPAPATTAPQCSACIIRAFVGYGALVAYVGVMLLLEARAPARNAHRPPVRWRRSRAGFVAALANVACPARMRFGLCPDPVGYLWLPGTK
jgi:hypothetical protein